MSTEKYADEIARRLTDTEPQSSSERAILREYIEAMGCKPLSDPALHTSLGALLQGQELTYKWCRTVGSFPPVLQIQQ